MVFLCEFLKIAPVQEKTIMAKGVNVMKTDPKTQEVWIEAVKKLWSVAD